MPENYIGLMSGTSLDGVDGILADLSGSKPRIVQHQWCSFAIELRAELLALNAAGPGELHRAALASSALARTYAQVVDALLATSGFAPGSVVALGAHGQTVRHRPGEFDATGYTLQLNNPALLAGLTGIDVVADFRSADVAAGGQGAPLVPVFHQAVWGEAGRTVCVLNVGGIANLTVLGASGGVVGFDCGPGNALMDHWCQLHTGQAYDAGGRWAVTGQVLKGLLQALLDEDFLRAAPPKSTGRDLFNTAWLAGKLQGFAGANPVDVQATLTEFTARASADALKRYGREGEALRVCGGGALNDHLMARLAALLPGVTVTSTAAHGMDPLQVEATAFAWLAQKAVRREKLDLQSITGARGARVLGCIYPA
jgi:anhydro-N-acetylmuramic acid kinase